MKCIVRSENALAPMAAAARSAARTTADSGKKLLKIIEVSNIFFHETLGVFVFHNRQKSDKLAT